MLMTFNEIRKHNPLADDDEKREVESKSTLNEQLKNMLHHLCVCLLMI